MQVSNESCMTADLSERRDRKVEVNLVTKKNW